MTATPLPPGGTTPIRFETLATFRDVAMQDAGYVHLAFTYDPREPYLLSMDIYRYQGDADPTRWDLSRDAVTAAALHDQPTWGTDCSIVPVMYGSRPECGVAARPHIRITLSSDHSTNSDGQRVCGESTIYLYVETIDVRRHLQSTLNAVPLGSEHLFIDIDHEIAQLLKSSWGA